jgi:indole-3-glycerol phosphate synthase
MMTDILSEIIDRKRQEVRELGADCDSRDFRERALGVRAGAAPRRLLQVLASDSGRLKIIAEFKRRSPSAGTIRNDVFPEEIAGHYQRGGACGISVLTDQQFFGGLIDDLVAVRQATRLPILRKDFIIDPVQIYEAAIAGADAVLLIVAALDDELLSKLRATAEDELGLDAVVEVHTSAELDRAMAAGATIIGVNNRDLRSFQTSLETSERLIAQAPRDRILISESGLQDAKSLRRLQSLGFRGFLIGEALMRSPDPERSLRDLISAAGDEQIPDNSPISKSPNASCRAFL